MGFWDVISAPTEALGELAGNVAYGLTGNDTAKEVATEMAARGPAAGIADEVGKAMGLNEAQRGYLELAAGVATLQFGAVGVQGLMYGIHDIAEGRGKGDDVFAAPDPGNTHRMAKKQFHGDDGCDSDPGDTGGGKLQHGPGGGSSNDVNTDSGYCPPPSSSGQMDYARALATIDANYDTLDTASGQGGRDGVITDADLRAILANPDAPQDLKDACRFMLDNPAYLHQADVGSGQGNVDGFITHGDIEAEMAKHPVQSEAPAASSSTGSASSSSGGGTASSSGNASSSSASSGANSSSYPDDSDIDAIINNPNLSSEEMVSKVLAKLEKKLDQDIKDDLKKLKGPDGKVDPVVQHDLQMAVEAKSELESLATNYSKSQHDTRSQIIGNIR